MAKFLNTSGTTYHLEELIKKATDRLVLISPYLQFNERIKELLEDKNRLKIDIRIVYGKSELSPQEINWLKDLTFVRTSFCKNLHAKCYLNEHECIITSLNLYEFSQVNNNEMGVLINKNDDGQLYADTYDEVQRIIRISEEVRLSADTNSNNDNHHSLKKEVAKNNNGIEKISVAKLAKIFNLKNADEMYEKLAFYGCVQKEGDEYSLTDIGRQKGGEEKFGRFGKYHQFPENLEL